MVQKLRPADNLRKYKKKQNPKNKVILQFKIWINNVNFRLYFKVIIRQNETQYFTYSIYTEQESENTASPEARG